VNQEPEHDTEPDEGVRVTDRRRIDPDTGEVRPSAGRPTPAGSAAEMAEEELTEAAGAQAEQVAELTADLQRVAAEYKNYRDRVQREISEARTRGRAEVVAELIETLDDLDRAAEHGDLTGPVKALADNLEAALTKMGVERFGVDGEAFDPGLHEAMTYAEAGDGETYETPTVTTVYQPGYRMGDRIIRAARVAVTE